MFGVIDCGTTNTRFCIIDDNEKCHGCNSSSIGVRDTAIRGNNEYLRREIEALIARTLQEAHIQPTDLDIILASGMITSEIGLVEIPHLFAPVGKKELAENIRYFSKEEGFLNIGIPIAFIPGVRNRCEQGVTLDNVNETDCMRGEEVQAVAVGECFGNGEALDLVMLSSHTKIVHIDADGKIQGSVTTMSGQIFDALLKQTSLGKSVTLCETDRERCYSNAELIESAYSAVRDGSLLRCLMTPRFMEVFMESSALDRLIYLDALIAGEDMKAFDEMERKGFSSNRYVLFGHELRCEIYEYILRRVRNDPKIIKIHDKDQLLRMMTHGTLQIYREYQKNKEGGKRK